MPQAGQRVSEYVLDALLGQGTFGQVWRARHHVWADRVVAIKIPTEAAYIRNLQSEGTAIHGLEHPNIVRAIGFDPYADPPYLVMEYVPGTNLRTIIRQRGLSRQNITDIMLQILAGLQHAHTRGIVHRDIKPENVLVRDDAAASDYQAEGCIKVTDFGLGKAANLAGKESIAFSMPATPQSQGLAGTIAYMAPEQQEGDNVDGRADLYACGVILHELLTGAKPAGTELPGDLDPAARPFNEVFRQAYARLEKRFASAADFAAALEALGHAAAPPPLPPPLPGRAGAGGRTACPSCNLPVGPADQFCIHCGTQLVAWVVRCPQCGAWPDPTQRFCTDCGATLGPPPTTV